MFLAFLPILLLGVYLYRRFGILDNPTPYGFKRKPVPYSIGLFITLVWAMTVLGVMGLANLQVLSLVFAVLTLSVVGFVDDRRGLSPAFRLLVQILLAVFLVSMGFALESFSNFLADGSPVLYLPNLGLLLSVFWMVFLINAMNFLDGIPSLTTGVSSTALVFLIILAQIPNFHVIDQALFLDLALLTLPLWVASFVFEFPLKKPKFLPGDSGATVMGLLLAVFSIMAGGKLAILSLVLLLPLIDVLFVIARRIWQGRKPWVGDYTSEHLHHILRFLGMPLSVIVILYLTISASFGYLALNLWTSTTKLVALVVLSLALVIFLSLIYNWNGYSRRN